MHTEHAFHLNLKTPDLSVPSVRNWKYDSVVNEPKTLTTRGNIRGPL